MVDLQEVIKLDLWMQVYLLLMVSDFITGFLKAWKAEGFKSRKIRDGVIRVIGEIVAIFVCGLLDILFNLGGIALLATKALFIFKEVVSINENLGIVGVKLPKFIMDKIEDLKDINKLNKK